MTLTPTKWPAARSWDYFVWIKYCRKYCPQTGRNTYSYTCYLDGIIVRAWTISLWCGLVAFSCTIDLLDGVNGVQKTRGSFEYLYTRLQRLAVTIALAIEIPMNLKIYKYVPSHRMWWTYKEWKLQKTLLMLSIDNFLLRCVALD